MPQPACIQTCIRQTDLPGTSKLFSDFLYHFDRVSGFYRHDPHNPASFRTAAAEVHYPEERRAALVAALRKLNGESETLNKLAQPGTVAVVTGQQVGLFSGPAYTIYKALTAVKLARELTAGGIPAVPVFWLATEDHDFAEVDHVWAFGATGVPQVLRVSPSNGNKQRPVGPITADAAIQWSNWASCWRECLSPTKLPGRAAGLFAGRHHGRRISPFAQNAARQV